VTLLPFDWEGPIHSRRRWLHRLRTLPTGNFYGTAGPERRAVAGALRQSRPDVILCQYGHMALRVLPAALTLSIPLVAHFHGIDLSSSLRNRWYCWSLLRQMPRFAAMVVVGPHQQQWLLEHGADPAKVFLIPCGAPVDTYRPTPKDPSPQVTFLAVSRLVPKKGVEFVIQAFAQASARIGNASLLIVGGGPLRADLERLAHGLNGAGSVRFAGECSPEQVRAYLTSADVFVQHSIVPPDGAMEGSPVALAEAAACGLPVIATSGCGGTEELVVHGRTGYLLTQRDVGALADCMVRLGTAAELRRAMGSAARQWVLERFDSRKQIEKLEDVLLRCAGVETVAAPAVAAQDLLSLPGRQRSTAIHAVPAGDASSRQDAVAHAAQRK